MGPGRLGQSQQKLCVNGYMIWQDAGLMQSVHTRRATCLSTFLSLALQFLCGGFNWMTCFSDGGLVINVSDFTHLKILILVTQLIQTKYFFHVSFIHTSIFLFKIYLKSERKQYFLFFCSVARHLLL